MTHTPGPWAVSFDPNEPDPPMVYAKAGPFVAQATTPDDARLLAAAPELLATLRFISDDDSEWQAIDTHQAYAQDALARLGFANAKGERS